MGQYHPVHRSGNRDYSSDLAAVNRQLQARRRLITVRLKPGYQFLQNEPRQFRPSFHGTARVLDLVLQQYLLTALTVLLTLAVSAFVGYGFAAYEFKGKRVFFVIVLLILSIPLEVVMLPLYKQMSMMKLMDSYTAIVLPFMAHASTIFFFRQYLLSLPKSLLEAGRIDGATEYGIFLRLIVPIMKPAFSAMAILNGMNAWNNYLWPLLVIRSSDKYTLTLGLNTLINPYGDNYSLLIVGSLFSIIPIFILFIAFQKYFIEGMTAGAVKG